MTENRPLICIDPKKSRIRIHKATLNALGNPPYVQILINPDSRIIIVHTAHSEDSLAIRVVYPKLVSDSFELYSRELFRSLKDIAPDMRMSTSFRIAGQYRSRENLALFPLDEMTEVPRMKGALS